MIIELIGSPGSGKTTICNRVMNELAAKGYKVNNSDVYWKSKSKLFRKITGFRTRFGIKTYKLRWVMNGYDDIIPDKAIAWKRRILRFVYLSDQDSVKKSDYLFIDEGPTQCLTSVFHTLIMDDRVTPLISELNRSFYKNEVIALYFRTDKAEIINRLRKRNRKQDRFLKEDDGEMLSMIETKIRNLEYVIKKIDFNKLYYVENNNLDETVNRVVGLILGTEKE